MLEKPMRTLHELPRFEDRWSYIYLEYGTLDQTAQGLTFGNRAAVTSIPINQLSLVMLGPGTTVTHAAVKALAGNNCLLAWTGVDGVKLYAHSTGGTFSARRLLHQARLVMDEKLRLEVAVRMFQKRFPGVDLAGKNLEQIRGMEGQRVRAIYAALAVEHSVEWHGRDYDQDAWMTATPVNRALSAANSCLYGVCHAAVVSAGYSAGLGFIHTGKLLSFVYDVADLYKTDLTVPLAFRLAAAAQANLERAVRVECRHAFHRFRLMDRLLPDIAEVLNAGDDVGEIPGELEGRAVTLAHPDPARGVRGQPDPKSPGRAVDQGVQEDQGAGGGDATVAGPE
jgi:CRISP-associated protein Cas1